jgi:trehalose/maltose hydrolase-like predicted phosphorylase
MAARTDVFRGAEALPVERQKLIDLSGFVAHQMKLDVEEGETLRIEKIVTLFTSRDHAISEPLYQASRVARRVPPVRTLLDTHVRAWARVWHRCDIELVGSEYAQLVLRLHIFHLLQTVSKNTIDLDVGVPARGLHGEAYRGHIFWDELFIFPFLNLRIPEITRELLMYRYRRLPEAKAAAREAGYEGAMYPWQSGSDGREESQVVHLNPRSGTWDPDNSHRQRHINAVLAYNVWQYYQATGDTEFLSFYGAEMVLEIARFWASTTSYNEALNRYEIRGVMGPDEYHDGYPDAEEPGLNNNAYTNVMAAWVLCCSTRVLDLLPDDRRSELLAKCEIPPEEIERYRTIADKMQVPFHDGDIISQFEGYAELEELDWDAYRKKYGDIHRLDRILGAENDTPNRYKLGKQADLLMLFYLFSAEELTGMFERLGYSFDPQAIPRNIEYYLQRTSHGSTLSGVVHSWVLSRSDRERSWEYFEQALRSDIDDIQGGTTPEGIHLGAMAGTVDLVQRCYTGIEVRDDVLWFYPCLPEQLTEIRFRVRDRGHWLGVHVNHQRLTVAFEDGWAPAKIGFAGEVHTFEKGESKTFSLAPAEGEA